MDQDRPETVTPDDATRSPTDLIAPVAEYVRRTNWQLTRPEARLIWQDLVSVAQKDFPIPLPETPQEIQNFCLSVLGAFDGPPGQVRGIFDLDAIADDASSVI